MGVKSSLVQLLPFGAMVMVECLDVGLTTLSKAAMSGGMSHFVFVVYSNALATLILLPTYLIFQRNRRQPPLTFSVLCKFFLLGLVGIALVQNCVYTGISYSSPTLASALANLIPAFTFLLAVVFRMEKLDLRSSRSQIKILGTLVSISGGLIITLYKGPSIIAATMQSPSLSSTKLLLSLPSPSNLLAVSTNWVIGGLFITTAGFSAAVWNTFQAAILKGYPSEITLVFFCCLFGTIQSAVVALIAERDLNAWKLSPDIELVAIFYSAVFGSVLTYCVFAWCIQKKGPVFVAMFKPLGIAIAALLGIIFLGDTLYVGSVVGAVIIAVGFYGVIWAQSKEVKDEKDEIDRLPLSSQETPLLHSPTPRDA